MFHLRRLWEDGFFIKCNAVLYPYTNAKGQERAKTETDHLLVGRCGLVLVETKNIAGTITLNLRGWTQQKNGQAEESIGSAAAQNDRHKDYFRKFFESMVCIIFLFIVSLLFRTRKLSSVAKIRHATLLSNQRVFHTSSGSFQKNSTWRRLSNWRIFASICRL